MFEYKGQNVKFKDDYLSFNRLEDVCESLKVFILSVERAEIEKHAWKYAILAIQNALQGAMAVGLRGTNGLGTYRERDAIKWMNAYENGDELPEPKLDFFDSFLEKTFVDENLVEKDDLKWLHNTRNMFSHFNTDSFGVCHHSAWLCCLNGIKAIQLIPRTCTFNKGDFERHPQFFILCEEAIASLEKYLFIETSDKMFDMKV